MTSEEKQKIIEALEKKLAKNPCPRCGNKRFGIVDGYFIQSIQKDFKEIVIGGGPAIPLVAAICTRCGFVSQHALGSLGLLSLRNKKQDDKE